jgi:SAM-dependent methyltransferase
VPELYTESAFYRMLFRERTADVAFYRALVAAHGSPVLELGVGDGRVAFALADDGHEVVGMDLSEDMLAALEEQRDGRNVAAHLADARQFRIDRRFRTVTCPFNGMAHFHGPEDQAAVLDTVKAHLEPGGVFAFDVTIPDPAQLAGGTSFVPRLVHPRTGAVCRMEETHAFDAVTEVLTITQKLVDRLSGETQTLTLKLRQLHPQQTDRMLAYHGFQVLERSAVIGDSLAYVCRVR